MPRTPRPPAPPPTRIPKGRQLLPKVLANTSVTAHVPAPPTPSDHLKQQISLLQGQVFKLNKELVESRQHAQFLLEGAQRNLQDQLNQARAEGHKEMLSELEALWRSEHFGLELLYHYCQGAGQIRDISNVLSRICPV